MERHIIRTSLRSGSQSIESRRGASSHAQNPFMALVRRNTTENNGDVYGFSLVYSGNFLANVEVDMYYKSRAQIGINPFDFNPHSILLHLEIFKIKLEMQLIYKRCALA